MQVCMCIASSSIHMQLKHMYVHCLHACTHIHTHTYLAAHVPERNRVVVGGVHPPPGRVDAGQLPLVVLCEERALGLTVAHGFCFSKRRHVVERACSCCKGQVHSIQNNDMTALTRQWRHNDRDTEQTCSLNVIEKVMSFHMHTVRYMYTTYICMHVCMYACMHACMYVCK